MHVPRKIAKGMKLGKVPKAFTCLGTWVPNAKGITEGTKLTCRKAVCLSTGMLKAKGVAKGTKFACHKAMCLGTGVSKGRYDVIASRVGFLTHFGIEGPEGKV